MCPLRPSFSCNLWLSCLKIQLKSHILFRGVDSWRVACYSQSIVPQHYMFLLSDLLLIEEIKGFALVSGQLLQGATPLLDGWLNLRGGCVVLDVHRGFSCRLLGCCARRTKQTAETGGVRMGKWGGKRKRKQTDKHIEGWTQAVAPAAEEHLRVKRYLSHANTPCQLSHRSQLDIEF